MATNFPTSLDAYTTKIDNVDDVLSSHINSVQDAIVQIEAKLGVNSSAVNTSLDYFLKHSSGAFRTHLHDGTSDDGAKIPMSSIADATLVSLTNGDFLRYNSSSARWINSTMLLSDISDVLFNSLTNGDALIYETATSKWKNQSLSAYALLGTTQSFTGMKTFSGGIVIENRSSDPSSPVSGQLWFRTDL